MSSASRVVPWVLSAVLAGAVGVTWFTMNMQLEQKNGELTDFRDKYNQLVSVANRKLQEANQQKATLVADANEKLHLASQPEVEIQVSFRKALLSSGNVAGLKNTAANTVAITAEIERPSSGAKRSYDLTLDPNQTTEIGEQEGWAFIAGDTIKVSQSDHKTLTFTAP